MLPWILMVLLLLVVPASLEAGPYYNSSEPGCDGSDPNVLMCDDFEAGSWYTTDGDHMVPENRGWFGTIYAPITPPGAVRCGPGVTPFGNCAADGGPHPGIGGANMAQHRFKVGSCGTDGTEFCSVNDVYVRAYQKWDPGYSFGQEKNITITNSDGDIAFAVVVLNCGAGNASSSGVLNIGVNYGTVNQAGNCGPQNQGNNISIQSGRWYFFEFHVRAGANAVLELWVNDCGVDGRSCGPTPTLRTRMTGNLPGNPHGSQIQTLWLENWANPASSGTGPLRDMVKVSRVGPIGFAGASGPTPPVPPIPPIPPPSAPTSISVGPPTTDAVGASYVVTWPGGGKYSWTAGYGDGSAGQSGSGALSPFTIRMPYHASGQIGSGYVCISTSCAGLSVPAKPAGPPPAGTLNVTPSSVSCVYTLTGTPPDATGGWSVQYTQGAAPMGDPKTVAPYTQVATVTPGSYSFAAQWSKTGTSVRLPPPIARTCP